MVALTRSELERTDTALDAIEALAEAGVREIVVLGRRGPVQAAFTSPELKELGELAGADVVVDPSDLELDEASRAALGDERSASRRNFELLSAYAARAPRAHLRRLILRFYTSPVALIGEQRVEAVEVVRNHLVAGEDGVLRAEPTGERELIPCGLVLRSVGYRGVGIEGVPFDERRGVIANRAGRVVGDDGEPVTGLYCAGWIKRGPSGVIGTNKKDAAETVEALRQDAADGLLVRRRDDDISELLAERNTEVVAYSGWEAIDAHERALGEPHGRPRIKLAQWEALLEAARAAREAQ
jgi:ferredoxin--NADP+ reductase